MLTLNKYFYKVNFLETKKYTEHFLKLISQSTFIDKGPYASFDIDDPMVTEISSILKEMKLPTINLFILFKHHRKQQDIHKEVMQCSLNLPLIGYENTLMHFYQMNATPIKKQSVSYYKEADEKIIIETLPGSHEWVLVDSSVPHNIVNSDFNNPRCTVALRFSGNPTFEEIKLKINNYSNINFS
jgi:hypothetical protein